MSIKERVKILIPRLIAIGVISSKQDLAHKLGYKSQSNLSAILGDTREVPRGFVEKLCTIVPTLNKDWLEFGEGPMFKGEEPVPTDMIMMSREVFDLIRSQQDTMASQQRTIEVLTKGGEGVHLAEPAICADAK